MIGPRWEENPTIVFGIFDHKGDEIDNRITLTKENAKEFAKINDKYYEITFPHIPKVKVGGYFILINDKEVERKVFDKPVKGREVAIIIRWV